MSGRCHACCGDAFFAGPVFATGPFTIGNEMMGLRLPRPVTMLIAGALLLTPAVIVAVDFFRPHVTLRLTSGPVGGAAERFISAFIKVSSIQHPRVHFEAVPVADLMASTKAMEDGQVDLAIIRSDVAPPANGQTIAILRRDVIAFVLPPDSSLDKGRRS